MICGQDNKFYSDWFKGGYPIHQNKTDSFNWITCVIRDDITMAGLGISSAPSYT